MLQFYQIATDWCDPQAELSSTLCDSAYLHPSDTHLAFLRYLSAHNSICNFFLSTERFIKHYLSDTYWQGVQRNCNRKVRWFYLKKVVGKPSKFIRHTLGQVKFPIFYTAPQILVMVDLVRVNAKKIDLNPSNQLRIGLQHFMWLNLTV